MIHLPRCPRVASGVLIAKMAVWGSVRLASGKIAKLQSLFGPRKGGHFRAETVPCRTTVWPKLPLLFHYSPRAMIGSLSHKGWSLTRAEVLDWFEREAKPEAERAPEEALSQ